MGPHMLLSCMGYLMSMIAHKSSIQSMRAMELCAKRGFGAIIGAKTHSAVH
jgi:hypothetical protein